MINGDIFIYSKLLILLFLY